MNTFITHMLTHAPIHQDEQGCIICNRTQQILLTADADLTAPQTAIALANKLMLINKAFTDLEHQLQDTPTQEAEPPPALVLPAPNFIPYEPHHAQRLRQPPPTIDPDLQITFQHIDQTIYQFYVAQPSTAARCLFAVLTFIKRLLISVVSLLFPDQPTPPANIYHLQRRSHRHYNAITTIHQQLLHSHDDWNLLDAFIGWLHSPNANFLSRAEARIQRAVIRSEIRIRKAFGLTDAQS